MDLSKVESIKTIDTNDYDCKIFVETTDRPDRHQEMQRDESKSLARKRKKITIISRKKHRDGSIETARQDIYKNYGYEYARK